eukprot:3933330-Rhodomonas_salina.4
MQGAQAPLQLQRTHAVRTTNHRHRATEPQHRHTDTQTDTNIPPPQSLPLPQCPGLPLPQSRSRPPPLGAYAASAPGITQRVRWTITESIPALPPVAGSSSTGGSSISERAYAMSVPDVRYVSTGHCICLLKDRACLSRPRLPRSGGAGQTAP